MTTKCLISKFSWVLPVLELPACISSLNSLESIHSLHTTVGSTKLSLVHGSIVLHLSPQTIVNQNHKRHLNFQSRLNSSRLCILTQNKIDFGSGELKSFWDPEQQIGKLKNVTEHRRSNEKWTIQKNWQHRVHKTQKNKTKTHVLDSTMRKQSHVNKT